MSNEAVIDGLNIYRAVEACGERVMSHWATTSDDPQIREGFAAIATREANHARDLASRIVDLGGATAPTCLDEALAEFVSAAEMPMSDGERLGLFNSFLSGAGERGNVLATCMGGIRTAMEQGDPETKALLQAIFVDEKLSMDWCTAQGAASTSAA
jgi:hypothetical protein